jgi:BRCA1-associated protein
MNTTSQERSSSPGLTQAQESEVVHRKLESYASQYYTLLKSQLEQQRIYYESRLDEIRRDYAHRTTTTNTSQHTKPKKRVDTAADLIVALKQERQQLTQRLESIQGKCRKVKSDVTFLQHLNESLEANRISLRQQLDEAQRERAETQRWIDESVPPLQEKVTLLMLQLESSSSNNNNNNNSSYSESLS